jgi:hypothetical protein
MAAKRARTTRRLPADTVSKKERFARRSLDTTPCVRNFLPLLLALGFSEC